MKYSKLSVEKRYQKANRAQRALAVAVREMIKPVVRLMLRQGMPVQSFVQVIKQAYLQVAHEPEFVIPGRRASKSRFALITGMTRPDVTDLVDNDRLDEVAPPERWNRAVAVLNAWQTEKRYLDKQGQPKELTVRGKGGFDELVLRHGADMPCVATLDELARVGCVERDKEAGTVRMTCPVYIAETQSPEQMEVLGQAGGRMLNTMVNNILDKEQPKLFQQESWSDSIESDRLEAVRSALLRQLTASARKSAKGLDAAKGGASSSQRRTAGVGFYYFEE